MAPSVYPQRGGDILVCASISARTPLWGSAKCWLIVESFVSFDQAFHPLLICL